MGDEFTIEREKSLIVGGSRDLGPAAPPQINNMSGVTIVQEQTILILGKTGSGKSRLVNLLLTKKKQRATKQLSQLQKTAKCLSSPMTTEYFTA